MKEKDYHIYLTEQERSQVIRKKRITVQYIYIESSSSRLFLYGEAGGFFCVLRAVFKVRKNFFNFF